MKTQLFYDLTSVPKPYHPIVHFCEANKVDEVREDLAAQEIVIFEIDGSTFHSLEDMFKAFAVGLRMPKGWYGQEHYAPNADAFLEYLDDVVEWVPAKGHVVLVRGATDLWRNQPRVAGILTELWQLANGHREATITLVFVW
ncbi:MAG: barstar family protein [Acidobacteriota bacterium]|nr:barstar family protein [Acidobacteriota bacterium]